MLRTHLILSTLSLTLVGAIPAESSASSSPKPLLSSILAAGRAQNSVHYVSRNAIGSVNVRYVGDAAATRGIQRVTYRNGSKTGHAIVIVAARNAYVRADAFTLTHFMGFKARPSAKYAGTWIRIPPSDRDYAAVAAAVTIRSAIAELALRGPYRTARPTTINGQRVVGVVGNILTPRGPAKAVLYGRKGGAPLPIEESATRGDARFGVSLTYWNERVRVAVPSKSVPISRTGLE